LEKVDWFQKTLSGYCGHAFRVPMSLGWMLTRMSPALRSPPRLRCTIRPSAIVCQPCWPTQFGGVISAVRSRRRPKAGGHERSWVPRRT